MNSLPPDEWRRVRNTFDRALDVPAGERMQFVAKACLGDELFHRRIATLLSAHERARDFLETGCVATIPEWPDEDFTGAQFGPYLLESRVGGGGMGEVYRARDTRLGRTVAIKVLLSHIAVDEPARERFEREARVVAGLSHPHICTLHDIGTYRGPTAERAVPYLVMEFLHGETLADKLAGGARPVHEALDYAMQIGASTAHRPASSTGISTAERLLTSTGATLLDWACEGNAGWSRRSRRTPT